MFSDIFSECLIRVLISHAQTTPGGESFSCFHFTDREAVAQSSLAKLPEITQLVRVEAGSQFCEEMVLRSKMPHGAWDEILLLLRSFVFLPSLLLDLSPLSLFQGV